MQGSDYTQYYVDGNREMTRRMDENYNESKAVYQSYLNEAVIDRKFLLGDQRYLNSYANQYYKLQKFIFNVLHPLHQMIIGHQRENRKSMVLVPTEEADERATSQLNDVMSWVCNRDNIYNTISQSFSDACAVGLSMMQVYMDYSKDPFSGDIRVKLFSPDSLIFDPWWENMDLSDCGYVWGRDYMPIANVKAMLPEREKEIERLATAGKRYQDDKFSYMPEKFRRKQRHEKNLYVDNYYYMDSREAVKVHHLMNGSAIEWPGDEKELDEWIRYQVPPEEQQYIEVVTQEIPTIKRAIAVNGEVLFDGPFGDHYNFIPTVCYFDPSATRYQDRFQGIIRKARDSQYLFNRRMEIQLDALESIPTSGVDVVEDALVDPRDAFKTGQGQVRVIRKGHSPDTAIRNIDPPRVDASAFQMTEGLGELPHKLIGINEELMGAATDDQAGITERLRQGAGLIVMKTPFDNLDYSQKLLGERILSLIQSEFTIGKLTRIIGEPPAEDIANKSLVEYDVVVEDGVMTSTQKQRQFLQMYQMIQAGIPLDPADLIDVSTFQNKDQIVEQMRAKAEAQAQMAQASAQMQMQLNQAEAEHLHAKAQAEYGSAEERASRVMENQALAAENFAQAKVETADRVLKQVETIKKLSEIDLSQLERLVAIAERLEAMQGGDYGIVQQQEQQSQFNEAARQQQQEPLQAEF